MGVINQVKKAVDTSHANHMGGKSWDISNPLQTLRIAAASSFFGEPMYYDSNNKGASTKYKSATTTKSDIVNSYLQKELSGVTPPEWNKLSPKELMEQSIDKALDYDPLATIEIAVSLRKEENMRVTPQVILVRAAHHSKVRGKGWVRQYGKDIISRPDELTTQLAYQLEEYGVDSPIPNSLKRAWRDAFNRFSEYQLAKYRMESHVVKLVDVVNLVHPKGEKIDKLSKGELKITGKTWEAIISEKGGNKSSWEEVIDTIFLPEGRVNNYMAIIRNLRNLIKADVSGSHLDRVASAISNEEAVKGSKQFPFRFYSAYQAIKDDGSLKLQASLEQALDLSISNLPPLKGKVISLCDNSGSATSTTTSSMGSMKISTIGNLTGILTAKVADSGSVGIFGDDLKILPITKAASTLKQLDRLEAAAQTIGGSTENGIWIFFRDAIRDKQHWDHIFVYSDQQAGHGGLYGLNPNEYKDYRWGSNIGNYFSRDSYIDVAKLVTKYRKEVNPNVMVYLVQTAGYTDTLIPEYYDKTYILGGWSDNIIRFASKMQDLNQ